MALNRLLIASHLHLFFTLSVVIKTITNDQKQSLSINLSLKLSSSLLNTFDKYSFINSPDLFALNQFTANSTKLFLLFYLFSY